MTEDYYEQLADLYTQIGYGGEKSPELVTLLKALFSEEEALVTLNLSPLSPEPAQNVAERLGEDPEKIGKLLETMTDKGLIYCSEKDGAKWYKTLQLVPGMFELQFMKGEVTPRSKELARLFDAYFHVRKDSNLGEKEDVTPFARVIPVEKTVGSGTQVHSYDEVSRYIDQAESISVSTCYCRHKQRLLDQGCDHPDEVCLSFGSFARFVIQREFGREVSAEEAHEIMKQSEEAGLIHTSSNTRDQIDFLCNCCSCSCGVIQSVMSSSMPSMAATSNFQAQVDAGLCVGCGDCIDVCQLEAITLENDNARIDLDKCIGCGLCVTSCQSEAMALVPRPERTEPFASFKELTRKQVEDKIKSESIATDSV